jgi:hypothetical protein
MICTFSPWRWHRSIQRWLNMPNRAASTVSPGDSVLVIAASQPPVPVDGRMITSPASIFSTRFTPATAGVEHAGKGRAAVVHRRHVAGLADGFGDIGRAGNEDRVLKRHGGLPDRWLIAPYALIETPHNFFENIFHSVQNTGISHQCQGVGAFSPQAPGTKIRRGSERWP